MQRTNTIYPNMDIAPTLRLSLESALATDAIENAAGFGRWWLDGPTAQMGVSGVAARFLDVDVGWHASLEACFAQVVPEDMLMLKVALERRDAPGDPIDCEFRIINEVEGLRWLRIKSVLANPSSAGMPLVHSGVLTDITSSKHAAMRERFSFESTQLVIGTHSETEAVIQVIQLVCENLGWEWGAYWSMEANSRGLHQLACKHYWHTPDPSLKAFTQDSCSITMAPGEGLVGEVWSSARACWVEDAPNDPGFLRRKSAQGSGLQSGYAFPVSYVTADGQRHSPGVLEFFSSLFRQREAQLPNLSASIGSLIAQTVQRLEQQAYVRHLAQIDDLTGLNNRGHFHHLLEAACTGATASQASFGVLYIDLDRFKPINDAFGHDAGNGVLHAFAQRLLALAPKGCHVGRLGGDEFAILTAPMTGSIVQLRTLAESVLQAALTPFHFEGHTLTVSASVGISMFPVNGCTAQALLRGSDAAMYRVKQGGRNAVGFLNSLSKAMDVQQSSMARQLAMEAELHRALVDDEFFLEYQPVFDCSRDRMVAVEALVRWRRPNGEVVRPDVFIPIAEQSHLIVQIGRWVLEHACRDLALLHAAGFAHLQLNVNMAASEFITASLPDELAAVAHASGIPSHCLCLELTESMVMKEPDKVIPVMRRLRQRGFKISLDDFGMGHSSLSRLKNLPITSLKIDRSFVSGLPQNLGDGAIVRTILDLGKHMKLQVVAEGVETDAQMSFMLQFGCSLLQGFLLSRPMRLAALMERNKKPASVA